MIRCSQVTWLRSSLLNTQTNLPGVAQFHNVEVSATKRATGLWSLQGSLAYHWNRAQDTTYFGNRLRATAVPANPNDTINTDGGRYDFTTWSAKVISTIREPSSGTPGITGGSRSI